MTANEIARKMQRVYARTGMTWHQFAEKAEIGYNTFRFFLTSKNIRLDSLLKIAEALNMEIIVREKTETK